MSEDIRSVQFSSSLAGEDVFFTSTPQWLRDAFTDGTITIRETDEWTHLNVHGVDAGPYSWITRDDNGTLTVQPGTELDLDPPTT